MMHEYQVNNSFQSDSELHRLSTGEMTWFAAVSLLLLSHLRCEGNHDRSKQISEDCKRPF